MQWGRKKHDSPCRDPYVDDLVLLGEVLRRFLERESPNEDRAYFFVHGERVVLDGAVPVTPAEHHALLRATRGEIDATGLRRAADPETYEL